MTPAQLVQLLEAAANLHVSDREEYNDYRPEATVTEYLLTAATLRAGLQHKAHVSVETLYRRVVNANTSSACKAVRTSFGRRRVDVLIGDPLCPLALVEIKIGVRSAKKLICDADKILAALAVLDLTKQAPVGVLLYEVFVKGSSKRVRHAHFEQDFTRVSKRIDTGLSTHKASKWPEVSITHHVLKQGITAASFDASGAIDENGSASFICAALLTNPRHANIVAAPQTLTELKASSRSARPSARAAEVP